jgi:GPH family glycoside/pentoside/hexuronide:cation symporter
MAVEEDLSEWEIASTGKMFSYAFGYLFINFLIMGGFSLVFYYYEVELGVSVLLLGLAYVIFAIWNMINDPLLGYLTDRPLKWTKKWGLRAPWILISGIPILLFYFLIWVPPEGASEMTIFIWFIVITCLFDTFFSIYNDHVYGGYTNQFPSEYERRRSFAIATILMGILMTVMGVIGNAIIVYGDRDSFI